jgi:hypothetical protein
VLQIVQPARPGGDHCGRREQAGVKPSGERRSRASGERINMGGS